MPLPRTALVIGDTGGIGAAWSSHLRGLGCGVTGRSRSGDGLDLLDEDAIAALGEELREANATFDWILVATGGLAVEGRDPERALRHLDPAAMARSFALNAAGPALLLKHLTDRLPRDWPSAFACLSARLGSIGDNRLGGWMSYRASKAALNQLVRCAAVEVARKRPQAVVVSLHPGTIETDLTRPYARGRYTASAEACAADLTRVLLDLRPGDSGGFFDYAGEPIPF